MGDGLGEKTDSAREVRSERNDGVGGIRCGGGRGGRVWGIGHGEGGTTYCGKMKVTLLERQKKNREG